MKSNPPVPAGVGSRRNELRAMIKKLAQAIRPIVEMLRGIPASAAGSQARQRVSSSLVRLAAQPQLSPDEDEQGDQHQRASADKGPGLRLAGQVGCGHQQQRRRDQQNAGHEQSHPGSPPRRVRRRLRSPGQQLHGR